MEDEDETPMNHLFSPAFYSRVQLAVRRWMHNNGNIEDHRWIHKNTVGECEFCAELFRNAKPEKILEGDNQ